MEKSEFFNLNFKKLSGYLITRSSVNGLCHETKCKIMSRNKCILKWLFELNLLIQGDLLSSINFNNFIDQPKMKCLKNSNGIVFPYFINFSHFLFKILPVHALTFFD